MAGRRAGVRRWAAIGAAALVLLASCSEAEPNRGARDGDRPAPTAEGPGEGSGAARRDATLTGRIVGPDGTPVAGAPVTVVERDRGRLVDAALTAIFTLGIACVAAPATCDGGAAVADSGTTDADGRYSLTLPGAYLPGFETDEDWVLQVGRAPGAGELTGPASSFELEVNTAVQEAPDLPLWDGTPRIDEAGPLLQISLPPLRAALDDRSPRFVDDAGADLWRVDGDTVDPRVLEDRPLRLVSSGRADLTVQHDDGRTIYHQQVVTATVPYQGGLVPLSRATPCTLSTESLVGCWVTDGDLLGGTELTPGAAVTVDLGTPAEVGLVVVRGTPSAEGAELTVEASADGTTWAPLPARALDGAPGWSAGLRPGGGVPVARFVRVTAPRAHALAEVSVWGPTEQEARVAAGGAHRAGDAGDDRATEDDDVPWPLALVAVALVGGVGVGLVRGRRRARV